MNDFFAVVAAEVKDLAKQTNTASEEIRRRIGAMQASTQQTVEEIEAISEVILDVNDNINSIATAVEEQSVTAREITHHLTDTANQIQVVSNNVHQTADMSQDINQSITTVSRASSDVSAASTQVNANAASLSALGGRLRSHVDRFKV
jgi:methyl-accepting chemotaxis protein